jgi:hypothetical protein
MFFIRLGGGQGLAPPLPPFAGLEPHVSWAEKVYAGTLKAPFQVTSFAVPRHLPARTVYDTPWFLSGMLTVL